MHTLGQAIRARRMELGLTLGAVAARAGCAPGYLSQIENARRDHPPTAGVLRRIEEALDLPRERLVVLAQWERAPREIRAEMARLIREEHRFLDLLGLIVERGLVDAYASGALAEAIAHIIDDPPAPMDGQHQRARSRRIGATPIPVPILNRVRDGYPDAPPDDSGPPPPADDHIVTPGVWHPLAIAIRIVGDEMEPAYTEGDIVVGEPTPDPIDGADSFIRFHPEGDATFRRVYREGATVFRLQPVNCRYPPRFVDRADIARIWAVVRIVRHVAVG